MKPPPRVGPQQVGPQQVGPSQVEGASQAAPPLWASAVITEELHCRKCGYDLRGLPADGRCPECGMETWASVMATVDPAGARLPSLRNPPAVGNALVLFMLCLLVACVLLVFSSVQAELAAWEDKLGVQFAHAMPELTWPFSLALSAIGLYALWLLAPPHGSEPRGAVWQDLWRIAVGYVGWLAFSTLWIEISNTRLAARSGPEQRIVIHLAAAVFATISLIGLRGVFRVIGLRSRVYRRSRGGRQSVELIIVAIGAGWLGELVHYATSLGWFPGKMRTDVRAIATVVMWISSLMVIIGLCYLVLNAWWIRRSLRKPPPAFDQILLPSLPADAWIPDREE